MTCIWIYDDCGKPCVGAYESIQRALLLLFWFRFFLSSHCFIVSSTQQHWHVQDTLPRYC